MHRFSFMLPLSTLTLCVVAWASDVPLVASSVVPAATGKVTYEHDRNGNLKFKIEVKHLADPARLTPAKNCYVVWIRAADGQSQNAGVLRINRDLEGSLTTTTPDPTRRSSFSIAQ